MQKTMESPGDMPDTVFGLGLDQTTLSCTKIWGHGGDIHGYETRGGVNAQGKAFSVAVTALPGTTQDTPEDAMKAHEAILTTVDTALCRK
jgi:D-alanyl-D-alanine carboxypeptidase